MFQPNLQKSKKYALIIVGVLLLSFIGLFIVGTFFSKKQEGPKQITKQELSLRLPYITKEYSVVYSQDKNQIYVNVLNPPYEENRQKALKWIKKQGADPNKLNIFYTPGSQFKQINP